MNIRAMFTENLKLKALSLLFAAVLLLFVALRARDEAEMPLQVNFINLPQGLAIKEPVTRTLKLRMAGSRLLLMRQQTEQVSVSLDLTGLKAGKASFGSMERYVRLPEGVTAVGVIPETVEIVLTHGSKSDKPI